jgi:hypothetical protein
VERKAAGDPPSPHHLQGCGGVLLPSSFPLLPLIAESKLLFFIPRGEPAFSRHRWCPWLLVASSSVLFPPRRQQVAMALRQAQSLLPRLNALRCIATQASAQGAWIVPGASMRMMMLRARPARDPDRAAELNQRAEWDACALLGGRSGRAA